jgi:hypothetical protein
MSGTTQSTRGVSGNGAGGVELDEEVLFVGVVVVVDEDDELVDELGVVLVELAGGEAVVVEVPAGAGAGSWPSA